MSAKIIFLNGPPSSGKDTLAKHMQFTYENVITTKFSTPLKVGCHALLGLSTDENAYENSKSLRTPEFFNLTPREWYITVSEELMKERFGKDVFGYVWLRRNRHLIANMDIVLISDCGFVEELQPIIRHYGASHPDSLAIVRLHRQDCDFSRDSRGYVRGVFDREADLNNIEGVPENMFSDFVKIMARWGYSDNMRLRTNMMQQFDNK